MIRKKHRIKGHDGWPLVLEELCPSSAPIGTVIAGHAMMADKRSIIRNDRPCIGTTLSEIGFRVLAPDARGHGESGPTAQAGGSWTYWDLVNDTQPILEFARSVEPALPLHVLGHSLFGHTSLAWLARNPDTKIESHVAIGVNIWCQRWEPSRLRWFEKVVTAKLMKLFTRIYGRFPARTLKIGPMDEAAPYIQHVFDAVEQGIWADEEGISYHPPMANIEFPLLHVLSTGDRVIADPESSTNFMKIIGAERSELILGEANKWKLPQALQPDHMGLITNPACEPAWSAIGKWMLKQG